MNSRVLWIALAASAVFNLVFIAGYLRGQQTLQRLKTAEGIDAIVAEKLEMNAQQRETYFKIRAKARADAQRIHDESAAAVDDFWNEAGKANPDRKRLHALAERTDAAKRAAEHVHVDAMLDMFEVLNAQQREMILRIGKTRNVFAE